MKIFKEKVAKLNESSSKPDRMTIKELKELLNHYDDDLLVEVKGGDNGWAELRVGTLETETLTNYRGEPFEWTEFNSKETLMVGA